jgi:hypothetical protein
MTGAAGRIEMTNPSKENSPWPSLFDDEVAMASFERLRSSGLDERVAFSVAAVDHAYRQRTKAGCGKVEAYARSVAEMAKINAIVEGYSPGAARDRETVVYQKALREGLHDPEHPHAKRHLPSFGLIGTRIGTGTVQFTSDADSPARRGSALRRASGGTVGRQFSHEAIEQ